MEKKKEIEKILESNEKMKEKTKARNEQKEHYLHYSDRY